MLAAALCTATGSSGMERQAVGLPFLKRADSEVMGDSRPQRTADRRAGA